MTFGYVTRDQQMTLHKLDLSSKKYVNVIDLEKYDCIPTAVAFVPLGMTLEKNIAMVVESTKRRLSGRLCCS